MIAKLRQYRTSPKKVNLVACLVRKMPVTKALDTLKFTPKKSAPVLKKLIESATANAENNFKQTKDSLYIKEILVSEGPTLKRSVPISRGRVHPILKRTSNIIVRLAVIEGMEKPVEKKATKKATKAKEESVEKEADTTKVKKTRKTTKSK
ncbi:MAG: 50S ribosomal protein L22 [Candidatus Gracilibacteria bacterium]|jgi:large subunit ribosomal protein L22|nr:50S ribosomal protein L22 [Candidatus Gracilibacteria bacterium]